MPDDRTLGVAIKAGGGPVRDGAHAAASQVELAAAVHARAVHVQPMVVLLGGAVLGPRLGAASQVLYLAAGLAGLPVFAASPTLPQGPARLLARPAVT